MAKSRTIPIEEIIIGDRRRENFGDIKGLAGSIGKYGLLHAIVVDRHKNLVCGARRLLACRKLGWTEVDVRDLGDLTPLQQREIELEEDLRRKDLTPAERSKLMVEYAEVAEKAAKAEAAEEKENAKNNGESNNAPNGRVNRRGHPDVAGSQRNVEERTGTPAANVRRAKAHVTAFERYPFLEQSHWNQSSALKAFKHLESLPELDRPRAGAMIDRPGTPPAVALTMLGTLVEMKPKNRISVFEDFESGEEKRIDLSLCCVSQDNPTPDARIGLSAVIVKAIEKAQGFGDTEELRDAKRSIEKLKARLEREYEHEAERLRRRRNGR